MEVYILGQILELQLKRTLIRKGQTLTDNFWDNH